MIRDSRKSIHGLGQPSQHQNPAPRRPLLLHYRGPSSTVTPQNPCLTPGATAHGPDQTTSVPSLQGDRSLTTSNWHHSSRVSNFWDEINASITYQNTGFVLLFLSEHLNSTANVFQRFGLNIKVRDTMQSPKPPELDKYLLDSIQTLPLQEYPFTCSITLARPKITAGTAHTHAQTQNLRHEA